MSGVQPQQVRQLFEQAAPHYDRLNDLLSLLHRSEAQMVQLLGPKPGEAWLDLVVLGTALLLAERLRPDGAVLAIDMAEARCSVPVCALPHARG